MNHLEILDSHGDYNYVYLHNCPELSREYGRMYEIIQASGHAVSSDHWELDAGILLKNEDQVIAGAFFNTTKNPQCVLIHIIFVEEQWRKQGIYTKMHRLIDKLADQLGRKEVVSYIHVHNLVMRKHVMDKIGYKPAMILVARDIK